MVRQRITSAGLAPMLTILLLTVSAHSQTPTDAASVQERKVFESQETLARIAWVDETTILATVRLPTGLQVRLINIVTGATRDIGQGGCASLAPDRSRAAWVRGPGNTPSGDIWIVEFRSMQAQQVMVDAVQEGDVTLAGGPLRASCLTWSPDGRRIAVTIGGVISKGPLLIVTVVNGQVQGKVESEEFMLGYPTWSPDGERLAFTSTRFAASQSAEYAVNRIDTFDLRRRVRSVLVDVPSKFRGENLGYSPNGRDLLFDAWVDRSQIFAYDGSRLRRLMAGMSPAWHPDRRSLTFVRGGSVYVVGQ